MNVYPIISRAPILATARTGTRTRGWIRLVHWSPSATPMATRGRSAPICWAAAIMSGPWTAHCPPPDGIKRLRNPPERNAQIGRVPALEKDTKNSTMIATSPESSMMAAMPA